ncbi:xanthine dehydrogenase molybdopterin binding subunit [Prosthecomicrobium sp. N25]|uniref:xanthine dehydrogenase molybdopterin binding subunit n=1 Tax=Prosthecomicrobium sp. N25 TaxID=3129254 RepID=UPI0030783C5D
MNASPEPAALDAAEPLAVVRRPIAHDSAEKHVQGSAAYVDDVPEPARCLHVAPGYARSAAKGRITRLDLSAVAAYPGVAAVLTAADVPGVNDCSPSVGGDPVFAAGEILFHGQVVFAVAAETRDAARRAVRLAVIEVDAEKPAVTVEDALDRGTDVLPPYGFLKGDVEAALAASPATIGGSMRIGGQEHFYLEGQAALAVPGEDGDMWVLTSTQHPTEVQHITAKVLGIPDAAVVAECRRMGGGFGGKESQATQWAVIAALVARRTGRAAKLRLDRDDDMIMTGKRHDFRVDWRAGHDADGRITAVDVSFLARCGYSADLSLGVNDRTMFHADNAYLYPAARIHSRRLLTDTVSNTAFRGFGGPQGMLFAERMMDALAIRLGIDPLDVRLRNLYPREGGTTPYGMPVDDNIAHELVAELERTSDYRARREAIRAFNAASPYLRKGLALTPVKFGISFTLVHLNQAGALVHVYTDGSVQVNHGGTEMGQGLYLKVAQVVAEELGVGLDRVKITATTTGKVPNTSPTAASSGSDLNGMAAKIAAGTIRGRMAAVAAEAFGCPAAEIRFRDGHVYGGNRSMTFPELARACYLARVQLSSTGFYRTPGITWDRASATGRPFLYFAYGAACAEVTIDTLTGEMRVDRADILHDVGHSLNPAIDIGQIEGAFVQGMGWLTTEELVYDDAGRLRTHAPSTYKIPTASDVPADFRVGLFESGGCRADTIHRSKAVGEPPLMLAISVFSAITDAVASLAPGRVPPLDAPATPEAILTAVKAMRSR